MADRPACSICTYFAGTVYQPRAAFSALLEDGRRLRLAIIVLLVITQLYTLNHMLLALGRGTGSAIKPWLDIPVASFFHYEELFVTLSVFTGWLLAAGLAQLLTRAGDGKGNYEDMLCVYGFGIAVASLPVLLLDLPLSALSAFGLIDLQRFSMLAAAPGILHEGVMLVYSLSIAWAVALFCIGVRAAQRVGRGVAVLVGLLSYLAYAAEFTFINR